MGPIISIIVYLIAAAIVLLVVSRLNLGLSVAGFVPAIIAAAVIAIVAGIVAWGLGLIGITLGGAGILAAILAIIVAAIVLILSDKVVPGLKVNGFSGAIIAAIAIGVVGWILNWLLGLFGIAPVV